jgi:hypothetical protein
LAAVGGQAEKSGESISNSFSAAIFPSVYMLVFSIIAGVVLAGLSSCPHCRARCG